MHRATAAARCRGAPRQLTAAALLLVLSTAGTACEPDRDDRGDSTAGELAGPEASTEEASTEGQAGQFAVNGRLSGVLTVVDQERGLIAIRAGERTHRVRAAPHQLVSLRAGERLSARYASIDGQLWLMDRLGDELTSRFGLEGELTGTVVDIEVGEGLVRLATGTERPVAVRAHPSAIGGLLPGQIVTLGFREIGTTRWMRDVSPP